MINDDPHVHGSVMFGRGKFQNGVLIEPSEDYQIDPSDTKQLEAYRNKIWYVSLRVWMPARPLKSAMSQADYRARERVCASALAHFQGGQFVTCFLIRTSLSCSNR